MRARTRRICGRVGWRARSPAEPQTQTTDRGLAATTRGWWPSGAGRSTSPAECRPLGRPLRKARFHGASSGCSPQRRTRGWFRAFVRALGASAAASARRFRQSANSPSRCRLRSGVRSGASFAAPRTHRSRSRLCACDRRKPRRCTTSSTGGSSTSCRFTSDRIRHLLGSNGECGGGARAPSPPPQPG